MKISPELGSSEEECGLPDTLFHQYQVRDAQNIFLSLPD